MKLLGFVAAGTVLFALPFLSMGVGGNHHDGEEPHMDHAPRHRGLLVMVGDHHLEIVEADGAVFVFTSDAWRQPLRPKSGRIRWSEESSIDLAWETDRLGARDVPASEWADFEVTLDDGTLLEIRVPRSPT